MNLRLDERNNQTNRRGEHVARKIQRIYPNAKVSRTRDFIEFIIGDEDGVVVVVTPDEIELRLPTIEWTHGPYGPAESSKLWKRVAHFDLETPAIRAEIQAAKLARQHEFVPCRFCKVPMPPERRHEDVCHGCAERHLGVVH